MAYLENCTALGQTVAEFQAQRAQLDAWEDAAGRTRRHWPSDSPFRPRLNYAALNSFLTVLFFAASDAAQAATITAASPSLTDVTNAVASAVDGDTVIVPAGTASWTSGLVISKAITLQGQTTISGAGTSTCSATDTTKIQDNLSIRTASLISVTTSPGKTCRITGITFAAGTTTVFGNGGFILFNSAPGATSNATVRLDNCHFASLHQGNVIFPNGWLYGVADHNLFDVIQNSWPFSVHAGPWGSPTAQQGDTSWADYPWFGTEKAFFIETNTVKRLSPTGAYALIDSVIGARVVIRHNFVQDCMVQGHGTELRQRGNRMIEGYDNTFNFTIPYVAGGERTGAVLWHDNNFTGTASSIGASFTLDNEHDYPHYVPSSFGYSDGTSPWDQNDTDGAGHYVAGNPPHVFYSGSATSGTTIANGLATFTDSTKSWTPNELVGKSITATNPASPSYQVGSYITSNTSNTVTYVYYSASGGAEELFNIGGTYAIHRLLVALDQCGRGKCDQLIQVTTSLSSQITLPLSTIPVNSTAGFPPSGILTVGGCEVKYTGISGNNFTGCTNGANTCQNGQRTWAAGTTVYAAKDSVTGTQTWPNQAQEPCYEWNNVYIPTGASYGFGPGYPTYPISIPPPTPKIGIDAFDLGIGFTADTTPAAVSSKYVAALNGVDYTGTYTYPHPLVTGVPTAPQNLRVTGP